MSFSEAVKKASELGIAFNHEEYGFIFFDADRTNCNINGFETLFSIGSNSYNIKQSIVSNVPGIENEDEYKYSYARVLFDETEGMNFDIAANREVFVEDVIKYIYGKVPTEAGAYDAIIATGYSTVVLDKPLTQKDKDRARNLNLIPKSLVDIDGCCDTDDDGLYDFEEVMFFYDDLDLINFENGNIILIKVQDILNIEKIGELMFVEKGKEKANIQYSKCWNEFLKLPILPIKSDPTNPDSDCDGIMDCLSNDLDKKGYYLESHDTAPLKKGLEGGITGELTIVSCSNPPVGHGFLVYRSFVYDTFDFRHFTGGYRFIDDGMSNFINTSQVLSCLYDVKPYDYFSLGNAGTNAEGGRFAGIFENVGNLNDGDLGGIYFNREFAYDYLHYDSSNPKSKYSDNYSYTNYITNEGINKVIECCRINNYYNLPFHNCAEVAVEAWNLALPDNAFIKEMLPAKLKKQIQWKYGSRVFDILSEVLNEYL